MASQDISKDLPVINLDIFLAGPSDSEAVIEECKKVYSFNCSYEKTDVQLF